MSLHFFPRGGAYFFAIGLLLALPASGLAGSVPLPAKPAALARLAAQSGPERILDALTGLPYRDDGAINEKGQYALFSAPDKAISSPGLNCSGFVLEAARLMRGRNMAVADAARDRLNDSGPGAAFGQDWDFGLDLVLNVSEGADRRWLLPGGKTLAVPDMPPSADMPGLRGFDLHAPETWAELPGRIKAGAVYFLSFNKETPKTGYKLLHYHVGILLRGAGGELWLYHSTPGRGAYKQNLETEAGREAFLKSFANTGKTRKMLLVLEMDLPSGLAE